MSSFGTRHAMPAVAPGKQEKAKDDWSSFLVLFSLVMTLLLLSGCEHFLLSFLFRLSASFLCCFAACNSEHHHPREVRLQSHPEIARSSSIHLRDALFGDRVTKEEKLRTMWGLRVTVGTSCSNRCDRYLGHLKPSIWIRR